MPPANICNAHQNSSKVRSVRDPIKRDKRAIKRNASHEDQQPISANVDWKKVNPGSYLFHWVHGTEYCHDPRHPCRGTYHGDVRMLWQGHGQEDLKYASRHPSKKIQAQEFSGAQALFDSAAEKVEGKAIQQDVPWP